MLYVRWFRPFRVPDPITGLPPTSHSTRNHVRHSGIVHARNLVRPCHLVPKFGQDVLDHEWTEDDILDENTPFALNRYYDYHLFHALSS